MWYFSWTKETSKRTVLDQVVFTASFLFLTSLLALVVLNVRTKTQEPFKLSVFVFEEAEEVKIWWDWGIQCVDCITTKMNAHFVGRFFICFQAVTTQNTSLQGPLVGPLACSIWRFSLSGFLRDGYKKISGDRRTVKLSQNNTNSAGKIFCVKEITAVYIQTFSKLWYFVTRCSIDVYQNILIGCYLFENWYFDILLIFGW